ncbi:Spc19-domain-containing protein [Mycena floridula]|nr:Spc19-domain-containing protein [Mycena floridula]KAJ7601249.1 Spc19-domain-containing protein [Mycena floridula]
MSRISRAHIKARESIFAGGPELYRGDIQAACPPNLAQCVAILEDCCEETREVQSLLRSGTQDAPRMTKILESQHVFLLVNEGTIKKYKTELIDEIEPAIHELMEKAEQGLKVLHKKESQLQAKVEAAQLRPPRPTTGTTTASQKLEQRRLNTLVKQRERLESELEALEQELKAMAQGH